MAKTAKTNKAAIATEIIMAIARAIESVGEIPSGHLYARLMGLLTLDQYQEAIGVLKKTGVIKEEHYLLTWVGFPVNERKKDGKAIQGKDEARI